LPYIAFGPLLVAPVPLAGMSEGSMTGTTARNPRATTEKTVQVLAPHASLVPGGFRHYSREE